MGTVFPKQGKVDAFCHELQSTTTRGVVSKQPFSHVAIEQKAKALNP